MSQIDNLAEYVKGETQAGVVSADNALILEELSYINRMRNKQGKGTNAPHIETLFDALKFDKPGSQKAYLTGLALSGGGIRSATFALGVLQKMAAANLLNKFDYLSTVSGGGYIGSALTWWMSGRDRTGARPKFDLNDEFPFGTEDPINAEPDPTKHPILRFLRENGNYLLPGAGISVWSGVAIIIRAVVLNLLVWIPLSALLLLLFIQIGKLPVLSGLPHLIATLPGNVLNQARDYLDVSGSTGTAGMSSIADLFPPFFLLMLIIGVLLTVIFAISSINYSLLGWIERGEANFEKLVKKQRGYLEPARLAGQRRTKAIRPWVVVGLLALLDVAILVLVVIWMANLVGPLFTPGEQVGENMVGRLWELWPGAAFLAACLVIFVVRNNKRQERSIGQVRGLINLALGFAAFFVADGLVKIWFETSGELQPHPWVNLGTLSGSFQFITGVGFVLLVNFWVAFFVRYALRVDGMSIRYAGRRVFETFFGYTIPISLFLVAIGIIPIIDHWVGREYAGLEGAISIVIGVGTALWGHVQSRGQGLGGKRTEIVLTIGSILLVYGILLLGYRLADWFIEGDVAVRVGLSALVLVAAIIGWFTNINYVSLHRYYRDRLMEAFMPDYETAVSGESGAAQRADEMRITDVWETASTFGPLHLVNTNVVLVNARLRKYRVRGGDSFILSPTYCGSNATGWQRSDIIENGELTLPTAMATSGAAANPRTGVGGRGVTRNRFLSIAMTLLNFRLGYWIPKPSENTRSSAHRRTNHFRPSGLYSIPGYGYSERNSHLELSDGGHFENLGLYELVRRRCGVIVVCDGGSDAQSSYSDFLIAVQRIEQDFDATIRFDVQVNDGSTFNPSRPEDLIATPRKNMYPRGAEYADKGYFVASIDYGERGGDPWPQKGILIYLKTTMISSPNLSMKARGYKGANPSFPDESTADQFFDEEQFEAYRELGYRIADQMIGELDLDGLMARRKALGDVLTNEKFRVGPAPQGS